MLRIKLWILLQSHNSVHQFAWWFAILFKLFTQSLFCLCVRFKHRNLNEKEWKKKGFIVESMFVWPCLICAVIHLVQYLSIKRVGIVQSYLSIINICSSGKKGQVKENLAHIECFVDNLLLSFLFSKDLINIRFVSRFPSDLFWKGRCFDVSRLSLLSQFTFLLQRLI